MGRRAWCPKGSWEIQGLVLGFLLRAKWVRGWWREQTRAGLELGPEKQHLEQSWEWVHAELYFRPSHATNPVTLERCYFSEPQLSHIYIEIRLVLAFWVFVRYTWNNAHGGLSIVPGTELVLLLLFESEGRMPQQHISSSVLKVSWQVLS